MSDLVENLKKLSREHEKHIADIRDKIREIEEIPRTKALVGKCFKYSSSFDFSFNKTGKKWWIYKRVLKSKDTYVYADSFSQDVFDTVNIVYNERLDSWHFHNKAWIEISEKEYFAAQDKLVKKIIDQNKKGR